MIKTTVPKKAFALVEYMVLIIVVISCLLAFRGYIQRAYQGQMATAGESFAFGRQYDPNDTIACVYDDKEDIWYSQACYDHQHAVSGCKSSINYILCTNTAMHACLNGCKVN
ncbi:MAG: hypothetical protein HQL20_01290 [Candidatus Omnitrophica bacterium]|nr:hypothetical protein [Candidatus Omnitrophota bacterium]